MKKTAVFCASFTFFVLVFYTLFSSKYKGVSLKIFEKPRELVRAVADSFSDKKQLTQENELLKEKLARKNNSYQLEYIKKENEVLKNALELAEKKTKKYVTARVVDINTQGNFFITLDCGKNRGVSVGDAVVSGNSLAGAVTDVYSEYCVFMPVTAEGRTTGVMNEKAGAGLITGSMHLAKKNMCTLSFFGENDAKAGDIIVTSGLSDIYPGGLLVGKIHEAEKNITVKTETDFFNTRIFSVILS